MASTRIPTDTDVFVGWSSVSLWSLRKAKECGAVTVLERGSSHMRYQTRILQEEYDRLGMKGLMVHPGVYEKELQEYEEVDYIAIPSGFVKGTFLGEGISEDRLLHVPFGVNLSEFRPLPKEDGVFRVIHCGGLTVRKGVHYLLQAFSELKLPDAELWLIGSMSDEVKEFLRRFDNGKVFHRGPYPQKDLHRYYSQGSVFCLASIEEGLAMVILQAMACGLPIICTHNTGGGDIVRDGRDGFVVPIRDVESLKEKLIYLYENPKARESMGESARERVQGNFSWSHYGERTVRLYSNILNRRMEKSSRSANERDRLAGKALDRAPTEG
jgi:glycosyltransferase involved in cell wall biosynthesis